MIRSRPMSLADVPPGVTGYRGVHFQKDKQQYRAVIEVRGRRLHLGYFTIPRAAAQAYDAAAIEAWGAAAITNFGTGLSRE